MGSSFSVSETRSERGNFIEKIEAGVTIISAAGSLLGGVMPNSIPTNVDASKPSASQEYRSKTHLERFGLLGGEDLVNESYTQVREDASKRRQEELEKEVIVRNFPEASGSPDPDSV